MIFAKNETFNIKLIEQMRALPPPKKVTPCSRRHQRSKHIKTLLLQLNPSEYVQRINTKHFVRKYVDLWKFVLSKNVKSKRETMSKSWPKSVIRICSPLPSHQRLRLGKRMQLGHNPTSLHSKNFGANLYNQSVCGCQWPVLHGQEFIWLLIKLNKNDCLLYRTTGMAWACYFKGINQWTPEEHCTRSKS